MERILGHQFPFPFPMFLTQKIVYTTCLGFMMISNCNLGLGLIKDSAAKANEKVGFTGECDVRCRFQNFDCTTNFSFISSRQVPSCQCSDDVRIH